MQPHRLNKLPSFVPRMDSGYGVVLLICLIAIWPFISRAALPQQTDAELHIFRLAELSRLVRGGVWYPRWAPDFYYGYGYPIFNYYAPLTYYVGLLPMLLWGATAVQGVKFVFVLGLLLAGLGMYGFVRDTWGRNAGILAAAVYLYAPYLQYVDPHARGDLAESFSFGLFPLALWALDRLRRQPTAANWLAATLLTAAIILAHNLMAMVLFALLLAWCLWWWPALPAQTRWRLAAALLLGVGIAAFFWLPVALEQDAVNLRTLIGPGSHFDFRNHFLSWDTLLAPSRWLDWGATEPDFVFNLGLAPWLLAAAGLAAWRRQRGDQRRQTAFFAVAAAVLLLLMLPISTWVWQTAPLLPFLQFPWRLLGPAAAALAALSAAAAAAWFNSRPGWRAASLSLALALTVIPALPLSQIPPWPPDFGPTDTRRITQIELEGRWLGTTSTADFVPATVAVIPAPTEQVLRGLLRNAPPDRVNRATLPAGAVVTAQTITPLHTRYAVSAPQPFALRLFQFAFPGWQARINGQVVPTEIGLPEGFLVIPVPAGDLEVDVRLTLTPAQRAATILSALSLTAALALTLKFSYSRSIKEKSEPFPAFSSRPSRLRGEIPSNPRSETSPSARVVTLALTITAAAITLLHLTLLQPAGWLYLHSTGLRAIPAQTDVYLTYNAEAALIGYDTPAALRPGQTASLTLYWRALTAMPHNYQVFVHLLGPDGRVAAQSDKLNPGDFPTRRWPLDRYVRDEHRLALPASLPPGDYQLTVGLWLSAESRRLPVQDESGQPLGDYAILQRYHITP